jgi:hypothetical protein
MRCDIPFTSLRIEPYKLRRGELVKVIARAYNLFEWGPWS